MHAYAESNLHEFKYSSAAHGQQAISHSNINSILLYHRHHLRLLGKDGTACSITGFLPPLVLEGRFSATSYGDSNQQHHSS